MFGMGEQVEAQHLIDGLHLGSNLVFGDEASELACYQLSKRNCRKGDVADPQPVLGQSRHGLLNRRWAGAAFAQCYVSVGPLDWGLVHALASAMKSSGRFVPL